MMKRFITIGVITLVAAAFTFNTLVAQPGGGGRNGRGSGGVTAQQILGMLAFDAEYHVTDDQLVKLRNALMPVNRKQQDLMKSVRSGDRDFQDIREDMMALRGELLGAVSNVLSTKQVDRLKTQMQRQTSRRGRTGGRGGQRSGGAR